MSGACPVQSPVLTVAGSKAQLLYDVIEGGGNNTPLRVPVDLRDGAEWALSIFAPTGLLFFDDVAGLVELTLTVTRAATGVTVDSHVSFVQGWGGSGSGASGASATPAIVVPSLPRGQYLITLAVTNVGPFGTGMVVSSRLGFTATQTTLTL